MSHRSKVVITGIGLITPLGNNAQTTWQGLIEGRSGIKSLKDVSRHDFNKSDYQISVAGLVENEQALLDAVLPAKMHSRVDRFIQLTVIAGHEAMLDAGLNKENPADRTRFGAYMGVGIGGLASIREGVHTESQEGGLRRISPFLIPKAVNNYAPAWLSMLWDLQGPQVALGNACASSTDSVGLAFRLIRDGYADYMLAGGAESCLIPLAVAGFGNMRALSTSADPDKASRPFDRDRTGFVMSEGAAVLVLERADKALERGVRIYAEIVGYGATSDAYHMTAMHPEVRGAVAAINNALADGNVDPELVGYINAHGTGTPMNDVSETMAIKKVFGARCDLTNPSHLLVSSTKSMTGHMLGGAGAAEAAFTALALHHQIFPPTRNCDNPDPACDLDYLAHTARKANIAYALSNSFGFGGGNGVLAFKRY